VEGKTMELYDYAAPVTELPDVDVGPPGRTSRHRLPGTG
jgi:hypothetical protein